MRCIIYEYFFLFFQLLEKFHDRKKTCMKINEKNFCLTHTIKQKGFILFLLVLKKVHNLNNS